MREDARCSLIGELEAEAAGAFDFPNHLGDPSVACSDRSDLPDRMQGLDPFLASAGGEIGGDDLVDFVDRRR